MKKYILFDLDGTLTDPGEGITNAVMFSLRQMGREVPPREELYKFIGPPLWESYEKFFGMNHEQSAEAVRQYRVYYPDKGIFENRVYDGIKEMLGKLKKSGKTLIVATSKPAVFSEKILKHFGLDTYFSFLSGSELDGTRVNKDEVIAYALEKCGISPEEALMVGDRKHDIMGAKKNGIDSVGVLYGYGDEKELTEAGADRIASDIGELEKIILEF